MANEKEAVNTTPPAAVVPIEKVAISNEDLEAKVVALESEKAKLVEETANWKLAALKAKKKKEEEGIVEDEDEKIRRIAREEAANAKITSIDSEISTSLAKALKENKELKLALSGKTIPVSIGTHTEGQSVQSGSITPEQLASFKARGWTDKDIERYKRNMAKNSR